MSSVYIPESVTTIANSLFFGYLFGARRKQHIYLNSQSGNDGKRNARIKDEVTSKVNSTCDTGVFFNIICTGKISIDSQIVLGEG